MKNQRLRTAAYWAALIFLISANGTVISFDNGIFTSITRICAIPAVLLWMLLLITERKIRRLHVFHCLFAVFVAWNIVSLFWTYDVDLTLERLQKYLTFAMAVFVFWSVFRDEKEVEGAMQAFVVGAYVTFFGTIISFLRGDTTSNDSRFSSMAMHPDDLGLIVGVALPIAWYLGHSGKHLSKYWRGLNFAYPCAAAATIIMSGTRGAVLSAIPAVIYIALTLRNFSHRWRLIVVGLAVLSLVAIAKLDVSQQLGRLSTISDSLTGGSGGDRLNGRLDVWLAGWDVFTKNPVLGVGAGAFPIATLSYGLPKSESQVGIIAHNTYLSVLSETGTVGFMIFAAIIVTVFVALKGTRPQLRWAMYSSLSVLLIGAFELSFDFRWQTWLLFILCIAVSRQRPILTVPAWSIRRPGLSSRVPATGDALADEALRIA